MGCAFLRKFVQCPWQCAPILFLAFSLGAACTPGKAYNQPVGDSPSRTPESSSAGLAITFPETPGPTLTIIPTPTTEYEAGYAQGNLEAKKQIIEGYATIYYLGPPKTIYYDPSVGLPLEGLGCYINPSTQGRTDGHNEYISNYIAAGGVPGNSALRWNELILHPDIYMAQSAIPKQRLDSVSILQDHVVLDLYKIEAVRGNRTWTVVVTRQDNETRFVKEVPFDSDRVEIAAGPPKSDLVFVLAEYPPEKDQLGKKWAMVFETIRGAILTATDLP